MYSIQDPLISVIIPIYNAANLISRCIDSIIAQSFENYEIVIVDDGSTDNSLSVCRKFTEVHHNILVFHKINEGQTSARKYGLEHSKGKYIYFVDADDYIPTDTLTFLYNKITENDLDIVAGNSISLFLGTERVEKFTFPIEGIFNKLDHLTMMYRGESHNGTHAILYKKELFNKDTFNIPFDVKTGEDFYINLCLSLEANRIGLYNEVVYYYVENEYSITHYYKFSSLLPQEHLIECIQRELTKYGVFNDVQELFYEKAISIIFVACLHNSRLRKERYVKHITAEAMPYIHSRYANILCWILRHPRCFPFFILINNIRKSVLKILK